MKQSSKSKIASSYANALYDAALEQNTERKVFAATQKLLDVINSDAQIVKYLVNPLWKIEEKKQAIREIGVKLGIDDETISCLDIVAENKRFAELKEILQEFENIYYQKNDIIKADVTSVIELTQEQQSQLMDALEKLLAKKVVVKYTIKPEILGGLLIQCGSKMIDDSLRGKLNKLELLLKGAK